MFKKKKMKNWFEQGQMAFAQEDYQQAVYFFKLVIETGIKHGGICVNECFKSFVYLGDIYHEAMCIEEADLFYRMAAGIDFSAKFVLLKKELFHQEHLKSLDKKSWLKRNMIDFTDIIQTTDGKKWSFLIKEGDYSYQDKSGTNKREEEQLEMDEDAFWLYDDYLEATTV